MVRRGILWDGPIQAKTGAVQFLNRVPGFGWTSRLLEGEKRIEWFGQSISDRPAYLPWVCCLNSDEGWKTVSSLFSLAVTVPADLTLPAGGTLLEDTNWDIQFQIDQLRLMVEFGLR